MMSPLNTKKIVDLHNRDLERLVEPRGWQMARRQASASLRRWRIARDFRVR
jgi:hypothetical protein